MKTIIKILNQSADKHPIKKAGLVKVDSDFLLLSHQKK